MAKTPCTGPFSSLIGQYIDYKRSLGFKMSDIDERLRRFDNLAKDRGVKPGGLPQDLVEEWSKKLPMESECNRFSRISILRGFSAYLQMLGYESYIPRLPKYRSTFSPHIYTSAEMAAIFRECDRLQNRRKYTFSFYSAMPALVRMLYATGIRLGEAIKLNHEDVDLNGGVLILKDTKNGCDRLVPMSLSLREICKDYVVFKENHGIDVSGIAPFFTSYDGMRRLAESTIYDIFRMIIHRAGIPHGGRSKGPRLHDLRHTFCVNALMKMSEAGADLYHSMPILMTYVGHKSLEATNRYVRITEEMFPGVLRKLDETYKYVFPEIGIDLNEAHENETD